MPKRNQYNRPNFNQLGPLSDWAINGKLINFNNLNITDELVFAQSPILPVDPTVIGNGTTVILEDGNRASRIRLFTNITLTDGQAFTITLNNSQITGTSTILVTFGCAISLGLCANPATFGAGTSSINVFSVRSALAADSAFFSYLILGGA